MISYTLTPGQLELHTLRKINQSAVDLTLATESATQIAASAQTVQDVINEQRTVYGINTGFGLLANTKIANDELELLQRSIVLSHAAGIGELMDDSTVRLMITLKVNSLSRGYSGIRLAVIEFLYSYLKMKCTHACLKRLSGRIGRFSPLAHMCLPLLGEGKMRYQGELISAEQGLKIAGLEPLTLAAKEGLALLNGTQASTAFALQGLFRAEDLYAQSCVIGSISIEAAMGSRAPFDARIHEVRGQQGQIDTAHVFRELLSTHSQISDSHINCEKVQDPYCLRCQPQVLGACLTQIRQAAEVLLCESNGVTDNPLVFADVGDIISGGNFHAEPVAMAADNLAIAIAEIGALAERRIALLIDSNLSKLPPFLVENGGVNSGFMIAQVTAAALASENKSLAHPASVDSLPTSANQEDHVSMATFAARRLVDMANNTQGVLAVEWLSASQGLEFRKPLHACEQVEHAKALLRQHVSYYDKDRYFAPDIEAANRLLSEGKLCDFIKNSPLPSY
nr:histidine ammonia-lyase [Ningiella sp. W23]